MLDGGIEEAWQHQPIIPDIVDRGGIGEDLRTKKINEQQRKAPRAAWQARGIGRAQQRSKECVQQMKYTRHEPSHSIPQSEFKPVLIARPHKSG